MLTFLISTIIGASSISSAHNTLHLTLNPSEESLDVNSNESTDSSIAIEGISSSEVAFFAPEREEDSVISVPSSGVAFSVVEPVGRGCLWGKSLDGSVSGPVLTCPPTPPEDPAPAEDVGGVPTMDRVVSYALAHVSPPGAGLVIQRNDFAYVGAPHLAHATHARVDTSVELFGRTVPVVLDAVSFSFDFGDGTPAVVTDFPGAPYPDMRIQHIYEQEHPARRISLTTTWRATITNPWNGQTMTARHTVTTTEHSPWINVRKPRVALTDTAEELNNH